MNSLNSFAENYNLHLDNIYELKNNLDVLIQKTRDVSGSQFNELNTSIKNLETEINSLEKEFSVFRELLNNREENEINALFHVSVPNEVVNKTEALIFRSRDAILRGQEISNQSFDERGKVTNPLICFDKLHLGENLTPNEWIEQGRKFLNQTVISDEQGKKEARNYAHQYLEKAAEILIKEGRFQEAYILRKEIVDNLLLQHHPLLTALHNPLNNPTAGISQSNFGSASVKRGVLNINERSYKKQEETVKTLQLKIRLSKPAQDKLIESFNLIKSHDTLISNALPQCIKSQINIEVTQDGYEGIIDESTNLFSSNIERHGLQMGEFTKINFQGIGSIKIGLSEYFSMNNRVVVEVIEQGDNKLALQKMQAMLTMVGLGPVLEFETFWDEERKKITLLFHTFFPRQAYKMENQQFFYEISPEQLKKEIISTCPDMALLFEEYLTSGKLQKVQLSSECHAFAISDIAEKMRQKGAVGLLAGFSGSTKSLFNILNVGLLCSQQRFEIGVVPNGNREGTSPNIDHYHGGAGSVFTRLITKRMIMAKLAPQYDDDGVMFRPSACTVERFPHSGHVQIILDLSALERGGYAYERDRYGSKTPEHYGNRSSFLELTASLNHTHMGNEFMIPERILPDKVVRVLVESRMQKKALIEEFEKLGFTHYIDGKVYLKGVDKMPIDELIIVEKTINEDMWKGE